MSNEQSLKSAFDADEAAALQAIGWRPSSDRSACPDSSLLLAAEEGVLDDAALAARVMAHVGGCSTCRLLAADLAVLFSEDATAAERARIRSRINESQAPHRRPMFGWLTSAGLLATAAIAGVLLVPWGSFRSTETPGVPAVADTAGQTLAPTVFKGSRPAITRPEPELTLRGDAAPVPIAEQIGQALDVADSGDLAEAIGSLDAIVRRNPSSANAHLALGATLLRADRVAESLPVLERAKSLAGAPATDEFEWHLAVALVRSKDTARASAILDPLCRQSTMRGAMACAGLAELRKSPPR